MAFCLKINKMTHGSLFSGIGGFDLAAEWCGWTNVFNCDNEPFVKRILNYHFPNAIQYDDIETTDFTAHRGTIDVVSGGFPCQPFSQAGREKGTADDRYLWAEMFRAIRHIAPRWVVIENVRRIITIERGVVFERVQSDLESEGYAVQPFVVPACAVDAPHERYRVWFVAHRDDAGTESVYRRAKQIFEDGFAANASRCGRQTWGTDNNFAEHQTTEWSSFQCGIDGLAEKSLTANATGNRPQTRSEIGKSSIGRQIVGFDRFPTQSPLFGGDDGFPTELDGITVPSWRKKSIEAYGNAIVPQVAWEFFRIIDVIERIRNQIIT